MDLDRALLDRVFQPVADRAAGRLSCFGLARLCLGVAIGLQFVVLALDLAVAAGLGQRLMSGAITVLALVGADQARHVIARAERRLRPGAADRSLVTMRWQRLAWFGVAALAASTAGLAPSAGGAALAAAALGWLGCMYFLACSPSPPPAEHASDGPGLAAAGR